SVAGSPFSVAVQVLNRNRLPLSDVPVGISIHPGTLLLGGNTSVPTNRQGQAVFSLSENRAGDYWLNASVAGLPDTPSNNFTVIPAALASLSINCLTATSAGTPFQVSVLGVDAYGNGAPGTVHFTSSDRQAALPPDSPSTYGTVMASATLKT